MALFTDGVRSGNTIFASPCPLTRLIAAMCAGHIGVDIDGAATDRVPGSHIKTSFFKNTRPWVDAVLSGNTLLGVSNVPRHLGVEGSSEVPEGVVPSHARASAFALFGVLTTRVQHFPNFLPVLAHSPFRTNW